MPDRRRSRALPLLLALVVCLAAGAERRVTARTSQTAGASPAPAATRQPLQTYCITCHNGRLKTAGLQIDSLDLQHVAANRPEWEKIVTKLRTGEMPPPGRPRPDAPASRAAAAALERELDAAEASSPHPGRVAVHRLNRTEYANAVRDLLGVAIDARALLSSDEADQEGFDNVASVLSVSPALLENYLAAARTVSRLAIGDPSLH